MNRKRLISGLVILMSLVVSLAVKAQTEPAPLAPPLTRPQGAMKWKMTVRPESKDATGSPANPVNQMTQEITSEGDLRHVIVRLNSGESADYWWMKKYILCHAYKSQSIYAYPANESIEFYPYASDGFFGIKNVKPGDDQGTAQFSGAKCRYYRGENGYEAWFDVKTGLPKAYRSQGKLFTFEFFSQTPGTLQLPDEYKKAWEVTLEDFRRSGLTP